MADGTMAMLGLVGDIGGTNARFALAAFDGGRVQLIDPQIYQCTDFASAEEAALSYLAAHPRRRPPAAVLAVAGPIANGSASFTNVNWRVSQAAFSKRVQLNTTRLINDYAALALSAPMLTDQDYRHLGPETPGDPDQTIAILGAGTGFGASALVRHDGAQTVLTTEGGHMGFAPGDDVEIEVLKILRKRFGRVSVERVLSGPGLLNLHLALSEIEGRPGDCDSPSAVTAKAKAGDAAAVRTVERFCGILGSVAGDFALAYGARGGVFIAGGVAAHLQDTLSAGDFRRRFEAKGRFESYLAGIPTRLILHAHTAALLGAARALAGKAP